jgi:hypothetical protein
MMRRFGVDAATAEQLASKAVEDRVPVDQRMADQIKTQEEKIRMLFDQEKIARDAIINLDRINNEMFGTKVKEFGDHVDKLKSDLGVNKTTQQAREANDKVDAVLNAPEKAAADAKAAAANKEEQQKMDRMTQLEAEAAQTPGNYGLSFRQRQVTDEIMAAEDEINSLASKGNLSQEETSRLEDLKKKKLEKQDYLTKGDPTLFGFKLPFGEGGLEAPEQDVELYKEARRKQQSAAQMLEQERNSAKAQTEALQIPNTVPNAQGWANAINNPTNIPSNITNSNAPQEVKIDTNGQQVVTVNLPNLQAMTNSAITAMVYEQVSQVFKGLSQEVRTANNFEDVSNALANAATKTQTVEMRNV